MDPWGPWLPAFSVWTPVVSPQSSIAASRALVSCRGYGHLPCWKQIQINPSWQGFLDSQGLWVRVARLVVLGTNVALMMIPIQELRLNTTILEGKARTDRTSWGSVLVLYYISDVSHFFLSHLFWHWCAKLPSSRLDYTEQPWFQNTWEMKCN